MASELLPPLNYRDAKLRCCDTCSDCIFTVGRVRRGAMQELIGICRRAPKVIRHSQLDNEGMLSICDYYRRGKPKHIDDYEYSYLPIEDESEE